MSSSLASIGIDFGGQHSSYSISKAALNMLVCKSGLPSLVAKFVTIQTYKQAKERPDLVPFLVDPGWVKTGKVASSRIQHMLTWIRRYGWR